MRQEKVLVTPFFIAWVYVLTKGFTGVFSRLVPVNNIFISSVIGREIKSTPHPPHWLMARLFGDKTSHVRMGCRHVRVSWVHDQRDTHCLEASASQFGPVLRRTTRHLAAFNVQKINTALFKDFTVCQYAANTAATFGPLPRFCGELGRSINGTHFLTN